eukprot:TRINITY_DN2690_c0_g2::TRINITY_DN2690_c0_g2_i2::g.26026::m.26026 TRINITY_DN2690_c0_g2::TRINITY_DN2690_c0_g2_i2::g.26026  ORF type:complete len:520 (+),score=12.69,zf-CCHC/PF00098.18/1.4e+03,zf-CCHC/PF00098.18/2.9e-05,zf-CCHC_5/PF14787.1/0.0002,zf-CCHC_4/PF14392.1/0.33,ORC6/PF05460.8/2.2,zf-CCHC_3/PF13917.1/1.7e+03,zf-CCHC_3/PF13917.1/0.12 TRINITY_DN2690_c0_g2_i2:814-2373(+)
MRAGAEGRSQGEGESTASCGQMGRGGSCGEESLQELVSRCMRRATELKNEIAQAEAELVLGRGIAMPDSAFYWFTRPIPPELRKEQFRSTVRKWIREEVEPDDESYPDSVQRELIRNVVRNTMELMEASCYRYAAIIAAIILSCRSVCARSVMTDPEPVLPTCVDASNSTDQTGLYESRTVATNTDDLLCAYTAQLNGAVEAVAGESKPPCVRTIDLVDAAVNVYIPQVDKGTETVDIVMDSMNKDISVKDDCIRKDCMDTDDDAKEPLLSEGLMSQSSDQKDSASEGSTGTESIPQSKSAGKSTELSTSPSPRKRTRKRRFRQRPSREEKQKPERNTVAEPHIVGMESDSSVGTERQEKNLCAKESPRSREESRVSREGGGEVQEKSQKKVGKWRAYNKSYAGYGDGYYSGESRDSRERSDGSGCGYGPGYGYGFMPGVCFRCGKHGHWKRECKSWHESQIPEFVPSEPMFEIEGRIRAMVQHLVLQVMQSHLQAWVPTDIPWRRPSGWSRPAWACTR